MLFTEPRFFLFFALVFAVCWGIPRLGMRKLWLLAASYAFYAAWDWRFLSLIILSSAIDYGVGRILDRPDARFGRRFWLVLSLVTNLSILGVFKYLNFFISSTESMLLAFGVEPGNRTLALVLPIGISFYTFQSMSYSIDIYRRHIRAVRSPMDFALFVGFFPGLVAGPIVRAGSFLPQLRVKQRFSEIPFRACFGLFLVGFIKKTCIADNIGLIVDQVYGAPGEYSSASVVLATVFFAIQLYCDFSGYSDMAIAIARLLGFELPRNFAFPYFAPNPVEFWRRWHISLTTWIRDYLYIPLGGNRGPVWFNVRNLMIAMVLAGLWHGAAWTYVIWGAMHGALLSVGIWLRRRHPGALATMPAALGTILMFAFWTFSMLFFRAENLGDAMTLLASLFDGGAQTIKAAYALWLLPLGLAHWLSYRGTFSTQIRQLPDWVYALGYAVIAVHAFAFVPMAQRPFIYFQF
ncbi:MAG: MBOAT family O-acyltransferase [Myxococcota bacterium]